MNPEKLKKLQEQVRIGGKGTPRRKKKIVHSNPATDDKKLQTSLKKLSLNVIRGIDEVNIIKEDGTVIHFNYPKAQGSLPSSTFAITGHGESKPLAELLPGILPQLGSQEVNQLKKISADIADKLRAAGVPDVAASVKGEEDDMSGLIANFEKVAIAEENKAETSPTEAESDSTEDVQKPKEEDEEEEPESKE